MNTFTKGLFLAATAFVVAGIGGASVAHAQDTIPVQKPFRVKIGGYFPTDGDVKDAFGKNFITGGVSYDFSKTTATSPVIYNAFVDYTGKSRDGAKYGIFGVGAAARFLLAPATEKAGQPYAEAGLGYYSVKADAQGASETKGRFGGKVALGYQLPVGVFGEVEYTLISKIDDLDPSGFRASIGYRF